MGAPPTWPLEATDAMVELWKSGASAAEVSRALRQRFGLSFSRSAVLGKVHRLGITRPSAQTPKAARVRPPAAVSAVYVRVAARYAAEQAARAAAAAKPAPETPRGAHTILSIKSGMCKWPIGDPKDADFSLCGESSFQGGVYCARHHVAAYAPPKPGSPRSANALARSLRRYTS